MSLSAVTEASGAVDAAKNRLDQAVRDARAEHTWQEIAGALGITRQAAQQRFAPAQANARLEDLLAEGQTLIEHERLMRGKRGC